jgi:uncharacterized coiled-coil DUF342 family protein
MLPNSLSDEKINEFNDKLKIKIKSAITTRIRKKVIANTKIKKIHEGREELSYKLNEDFGKIQKVLDNKRQFLMNKFN